MTVYPTCRGVEVICIDRENEIACLDWLDGLSKPDLDRLHCLLKAGGPALAIDRLASALGLSLDEGPTAMDRAHDSLYIVEHGHE